MHRTYGKPRFGSAEGASLSGAVPDVCMGLVVVREWVPLVLVVVAGCSSRMSTCVSAFVVVVVVVVGLGPCVCGRLVDDRRSESMSGGGKDLGSETAGVCVSSYGRANWCVSVFGSGNWSGCAVVVVVAAEDMTGNRCASKNGAVADGIGIVVVVAGNGVGGEAGGEDDHRNGGRKDSESACSGRHCQSSLRCVSGLP